MKNRTLEEIIRAEQSHRHEGGQFGINACKKSIRFSVEYLGENLADLLNGYVERANTDAFFNKAMVLACWELMQEEETEAEAETEATREMMNETKQAEIMAIVDRLCADNSADCRGLSLSGVASDLLDAVGIDPYLDIFEIPVHSDSQVCVCFWFNGEPFELWAGLSYETKEFFTECRRWSEDANGEIVDFSIFAETEEKPTETEATEEGKTMKNYISRRGTEADNINAVIEAYEETRDGKTADPSEIIAEASEAIKNNKSANRSAWGRGVTAYALELLEELAEGIRGGWLSLDDLGSVQGRKRAMLNGASDWSDYSWGGCSLIYNGDIAERLCTPSELKRTRGGEWRPNASEEWLDTQARALFQASNRASRALAEALKSRA